MSNIELKRDQNAKIHLFVAGQPARGAIVTGIDWVGDKQCAKVIVPLEYLTLSEVDTSVSPAAPGTVVPFRRSWE